jgi:hypothetical protein
VYGDACKEWEKQNILDKNWENFKAHFTIEHRLYRKQTHTAQASGFHAANHVQRGLQDALLIEQSESLAMMATASAADRGTTSNLVTSNAQLSTNLAEKSAALPAANAIIRTLRSASRPTGGAISIATLSPSNTRAANSGTTRVRPVTNNYN